MRVSEHRAWAASLDIFGSAPFSAALTLASIGAAFSVHLLRSVMGWPGLLGVLGALVLCASFSLFARRHELDWRGILPISLLLYLVWCALTIVWSSYQASTIAGVLYQLAFAVLALYVALVRDLIQIVRAAGDVFRALLTASLALEILSGLLLDLPITFLKIQGNLYEAGPLQGIFGTRNMLGFVSLIALVTFLVERSTKSVQRGLSAYSIALAAILLLGSRSPISLGIAALTLAATFAMLALRRAQPELRRILQTGMLMLLLIGAVTAYFVRTRILTLLGAQGAFDYRLQIWNQLNRLIDYHQLEGWGWVGAWPTKVSPFSSLSYLGNRQHNSGLNAFIDVYFQIGLVGLAIFVGMVGLAFVRSWILATSRKSVIYLWPALMLIVLVVTSLAESVILIEYGWMLFVMCLVKVAESMSWRQGLALDRPGAGLPRGG